MTMTTSEPTTTDSPGVVQPGTGQHETTVEIDGEPTVLRRAGAGRAVLYLHGAFAPTRWTRFHDRMAERFDLVAPLHPGYAEGHPPDWLRSFEDLVLHYRSLLDVLELDRVDLVGYDLGGWIGAQLAARHPDRIASFTVVAPLGLRLPESPPMEFLAADPRAVEHAFFGGPAGEHTGLFADARDIEAFTDAYGENAVTARLIWERHYDVSLDRRVPRIAAPSLVVSPGEDLVVPLAHAERWAELLPNSRLVTLDGVGHALLLQAPDRVAHTIGSFIEEVAA